MQRDRRRRDLVKCEDMRLFAQRAIRYVGEKEVAEFEADEILQAAAPEIPWSDIIGMRQLRLLVSTLEAQVGWNESM